MVSDITLLGATGYTGGLTADYLGAHLPAGATWAVAGRSRAKLEEVADRIESAVHRVLAAGHRTGDIALPGEATIGTRAPTTARTRANTSPSPSSRLSVTIAPCRSR